MRTLVVGAAIVDLMMKIDRLPKSGEDIPCKETKTVVGGCAYNVANTLRNLNCEHDLCVPVGSGSFADIIRRGMKEKGYELLIEEPGEDNGYCLSLVEADGEHLSRCRERNATSKKSGLTGLIWTDMKISTSQAIRFVEKVVKSFHSG